MSDVGEFKYGKDDRSFNISTAVEFHQIHLRVDIEMFETNINYKITFNMTTTKKQGEGCSCRGLINYDISR